MSAIGEFLGKIYQNTIGKNKSKTTTSTPTETSNTYTKKERTYPYTSSTGNVYNTPREYYIAVGKSKGGNISDPIGSIRSRFDEYHDGELDISDLNYVYNSRQRKKEYDNKIDYARKSAVKEAYETPQTKRGAIDRVFGVIGNNSVPQALYNITDDDEDTTFLGGLAEGIKYMNPFEDDVSGRKTFSDVIKNTFLLDKSKEGASKDYMFGADIINSLYGREVITDERAKDDIEKLTNFRVGALGFVGDVFLDPLTYVGVGGVSKVVKGSGYTLDAVKALKKSENLTSVREVAKYLDGLADTSNNVNKIDKVLSVDSKVFNKQAESIANRTGGNVDEIANSLKIEYAKNIERIKFDDGATRGLTIGSYGDFHTKAGRTLYKEIVSNKSLTKLGDRTISPYYNQLAKNIRTSRLGKMFSTNSRIERLHDTGKLTDEQSVALMVHDKNIRGTQRILQDAEVLKKGMSIEDYTSTLSKEDELQLIDDIETGRYKNLKEFNSLVDRIREGSIKTIQKDGDYLITPNGFAYDNTEEDAVNLIRDMLQDDSRKTITSSTEIEKSKKELEDALVEKYRGYSSNDNYLYSKVSTASEDGDKLDSMVQNMARVKTLKSVTSYRELLDNVVFSDNPIANEMKHIAISNLDEKTAKKVALSLERDKLVSALDKYNSNKIYSSFDLQSMSFSELSNLVNKFGVEYHSDNSASIIAMIEAKQNGRINEIQSVEKSIAENAKLMSDAETNPNLLSHYEEIKTEYENGVKKFEELIDKYFDGNPESYYNYISDELNKTINLYKNNTVDASPELIDLEGRLYTLKKLSSDISSARLKDYNNGIYEVNKGISKIDGDIEDTFKSAFYSGSNEDRAKLLDEYAKKNGTVYTFEKKLEDIKRSAKDLDEYMESDQYLFMQEVENINRYNIRSMYDDYSLTPPSFVSEAFDLDRQLEKIDGMVSNMEDTIAFSANVDKKAESIANMFIDDMNKRALEEVRVGELTLEQFTKFKDRYVPHFLQTDSEKIVKAVSDDGIGSFQPDVLGLTQGFGKHRTTDKTIKEINSIDGNFDYIMNDSLHAIYTARMLRSDKLVFAKDSLNYIKENFTLPVDVGETPNYTLGALYEDINKLFKRRANKAFEEEKVYFKQNLYKEILSNPEKYIGENAVKNPEVIQKHLDEVTQTIGRKREDALAENDIKNADGLMNWLENYTEQTKLSIEDAEKLRKSKIEAYVENATSKWEKENYQSMFQEFWDESRAGLFKEHESADKLFTPNMVIQKLSPSQCEYLQSLDAVFDIRQYHNNVIERTNVMSRSQRAELTSRLLNLYDKFLYGWKISNTMFSPSFHVQNAVSNAFQSFLSIGADAVNPKKIKQAYDIMKLKDPKQAITLHGQKYTYKEIEYMAKKSGVINESFASYDFGGGINSYYENGLLGTSLQKFSDVNFKGQNPIKSIFQASTVVGTNIEGVQRMNLFISAFDKTGDIEGAVKEVNKFLFDYGDLTEFEQNTMKRIIPFYTFMRKNVPMELTSMLEDPRKFTAVDRAFTNIEKVDEENYVDENHRNEWRQDYVQIPYTGYGINPQLPYQQLDRLDADKLTGMSSPLLKLPIEAVNGKYAYTGMDIDSPLQYVAGQTVPTNLLYRLLTGANSESVASRYFGLPVDKVENVASYKNASYITPEERQAIYEDVYENK